MSQEQAKIPLFAFAVTGEYVACLEHTLLNLIKMCFHLCPFVGWLNFVTAVGNVEAMTVSRDRSEEEIMQMRIKKKKKVLWNWK